MSGSESRVLLLRLEDDILSMLKKEIIWREILNQFFENKIHRFTQKELAVKFSFSLSTVFNALRVPRESGAIEVKARYFEMRDAEKFLNIWATFRNIKKDFIYKTHVDMGVKEIEGIVPPGSVFAAYSAYLKQFNEAPADYDKVYIYSRNSDEIKKRFPPQKGYENLLVLKPDKFLVDYEAVTPLPQLYVDLWNLPEWYAKDFLEALKKKLF